MMASVYFWKSLLSAQLLADLIDRSMLALFNWTNANIRREDKPHLYRHLFSTASVKQVAHWFQIMRAGRFQMFEDVGPSQQGHAVLPAYPLRNITTPIQAIVGDRDSLIDTAHLREHLRSCELLVVPGYEHVDPLWAADVHDKVNATALAFLRSHCSGFDSPQGGDAEAPSALSAVPRDARGALGQEAARGGAGAGAGGDCHADSPQRGAALRGAWHQAGSRWHLVGAEAAAGAAVDEPSTPPRRRGASYVTYP